MGDTPEERWPIDKHTLGVVFFLHRETSEAPAKARDE